MPEIPVLPQFIAFCLIVVSERLIMTDTSHGNCLDKLTTYCLVELVPFRSSWPSSITRDIITSRLGSSFGKSQSGTKYEATQATHVAHVRSEELFGLVMLFQVEMKVVDITLGTTSSPDNECKLNYKRSIQGEQTMAHDHRNTLRQRFTDIPRSIIMEVSTFQPHGIIWSSLLHKTNRANC
jgi:hypothetical protein